MILFAIALAAALAIAVAHAAYRRGMGEAEAAWRAIAAAAAPAPPAFDPETIADLPEIAQRYFRHAIAPGTPLSTTLELDMEGIFLLGEKDPPQRYAMKARQILSPPSAFVWLPVLGAGPLRISGSDGLRDGHGWTRFWMLGTIPLVQAAGPDIDRSALVRPALEAVWAPASLLPAGGARWEQTGPHSARIGFGDGIFMDMTLGPDGRVLEVSAQRWSDANPERVFRLQPFGARMPAEGRFGGFTIPSAVEVGNHFGTPAWRPFFFATITAATWR